MHESNSYNCCIWIVTRTNICLLTHANLVHSSQSLIRRARQCMRKMNAFLFTAISYFGLTWDQFNLQRNFCCIMTANEMHALKSPLMHAYESIIEDAQAVLDRRTHLSVMQLRSHPVLVTNQQFRAQCHVNLGCWCFINI